MCFTERNASKFKSIGEFDVIFKIHFLIKFLLIEHADFPVKDACKVFLGVWRRSTEVWRNMWIGLSISLILTTPWQVTEVKWPWRECKSLWCLGTKRSLTWFLSTNLLPLPSELGRILSMVSSYTLSLYGRDKFLNKVR